MLSGNGFRAWLREQRKCALCGHKLIRDHTPREGCTYPGCECKRNRKPVTHRVEAELSITKSDLFPEGDHGE